ncbi:MAG TPA: glycosyl hydrolase family 28 protein [Tepidisphaeraceae bacterium]|nr:glycosyl hydrolase family 28 protein [Tepidisphaeraceae bacterium]
MRISTPARPNAKQSAFTLVFSMMRCFIWNQWVAGVCLVSLLAAQRPAWALPATRPAVTLNVRDFGAAGDGKKLDTVAIQNAIDACNAKGGGVVLLPAGTYLSGSILLKNNVTLHLDDHATLLGVVNGADYREVDPFREGLGQAMGTAFVGAMGAQNIGITGGGTIDGQGKLLSAKIPTHTYGKRPIMLRLSHCHGVTIEGVLLKDSACWTLNLYQCSDVTIDHVREDSHVTVHNDGMDMDSCDGVIIRDCNIYSGDDAICLKTTGMMPCENFQITGCEVRSHDGGFKLGTESLGDFTNITVSHCDFHDVSSGGIKLNSVDGAHLTHIRVSDVTMENVATPIFMRLGARLATFRKGETARPPGILSDVVIENVKAVAARHGQLMPPSGIFITGVPGHAIEDVTLRNIEIDLPGGGTAEQANVVLPEKINAYPELTTFGRTLPAFGLYARHVDGLTLQNVVFKVASPDARPEIKLIDVKGFQQ